MQQRRPRLGDILDDYCPRERRITNHAVVAMIEDEVKQTRCTTCDADHEYKQAKIPAPRRRKPGGALFTDGPDAKPRVLAGGPASPVTDEEPVIPTDADAPTELSLTDDAADTDTHPEPPDADADVDAEPDADGGRDEWVHRRLIRATLPRPEGQVPERKAPEFTIRQASSGRGEANGNRNGHSPRGAHRPMRHGQGQGQGPSGQPARFGGPRQGGGQQGQRSGQPQRHGSGHGQGQGPGGNRGGHQQHGGQRAGGGRKRGR